MSNFEIIKDIARARDRKTTSAYDVAATVTRIEGDTAWVHIDGGVDETPVKLTVAAHEGDVVQVRVGGGTAWLTGNGSRPPTDDATAIVAKETADDAVAFLRIQQAEIDRLKARYIETLLIHSPDYDAVEIPYVYPDDTLYPDEDVYPSDGTLVKSGFALDLANGLILGAFYSRQLASLEERVARLEQRNSLSMMMSTTSTDTEDSNDELR